jgi:hypothetical protein
MKYFILLPDDEQANEDDEEEGNGKGKYQEFLWCHDRSTLIEIFTGIYTGVENNQGRMWDGE